MTRVFSSSTPVHGSLTDREFNVAVAVARAETKKYVATVTSATATVGAGTDLDPNAGPACTSGTLLHIKLIGTFPTIVTTGNGAQPTPSVEPITAMLVTADPESGKACDIGVQVGPAAPDPGATLLYVTASAANSVADAPSPAVPMVSVTASAPAGSGSAIAPPLAPSSVGSQTSGSPPSAQQVVSAYIDALNAHDIARAKTYLTAQHAAEVAAEADSFFFNIRSITNVVVGPDAPRGAFGGPATGYSQIVQVGVRFTLAQYHAESMPNGVNDWSYILVRNSEHDPWLIADEGMG
jgi:hypothetical protein